ncbi:unnamed protein product [Moneuplotes crassus]|uniref:Uncharacterized protein n=2 Tax=Euplotes crassus TaxID=5936 RepID=A0AAD1UA41_EUPCR|nr:unnamed protein product [Moneuplotes crassus]
MDWGAGDSLKARSYGQANEYNDANERLSNTGGGGKPDNDWDAISKVQQEVIKKDMENHTQKNNEQKKQYYSVLDRQRYEKLQLKLTEEQMKQREMAEMKQREEELRKAAEMEKDQRNKYLEYMNNNYKTTLDYKREREREKKESDLEEERKRLKIIEKDLKEEQFRNHKKKENFMKEVAEIENHKKQMKEFEKLNKNREREEYQELSKKNYDLEVERENNYKKFFQDYEGNMSNRMSNHIKHVTEQSIAKQQKLDMIEDRNEKLRKDYLEEKDRKEREERMRQLQEMNDQNKRIFDKLDKERTGKKEMYQRMTEQRKKEEDEYRKYQEQQMQEEQDRKKMYRDALQYQKGYSEYNKNASNQMTNMEKKLNAKDLRTLQDNKVEYEGMVPGIHNIQSVGSKPLLRKANEDIYDPSKKQPEFMIKDFNKSYKELRTSIKPAEGFSKVHTTKNQNRYDPITNPVPFVNQNPYIMKEKTMIGGEGSSSLINHSNRRSQRSLLSATAEKNILI